jgi:hypothetical protein
MGFSAIVNKDTFIGVGCKKRNFCSCVLKLEHKTSGGMEIREALRNTHKFVIVKNTALQKAQVYKLGKQDRL